MPSATTASIDEPPSVGLRTVVRTLIRNLGQIASGDIGQPLLDADEILIEDRRIAAVGRRLAGEGSGNEPEQVIDAHGTTAIPGLIDSHAHPVFGDFTPRQRTIDFIESGLHGGVTTVISAGEVHLPGRPKDVVGLKALAIVAAKSYQNFRPAGVKVHAGAPILELGLEEADFAEMATAGVSLVGEIGLGSVKTGTQAAPMVAWAKAHGMIVTFHTGGPSIAGSSAVGADAVLEARPHIVGHINGGTTAMSDADIERLIASDMAIEIVHCGNGRAALLAARLAVAADALDRVIIGNDAPSGTGVVPLGILRVMAHLASLGGIEPEVAVAMATGNTARVHGLDVGVIAPGRAADICLVDAPSGSIADTALGALAIGDLPGVSMVLIDGEVRIGRSRNTPPAARAAEIVSGPGAGGSPGGGH
jgi:enamidase